MAIASIATNACGSTSALTPITDIAGKLRPLTARHTGPSSLVLAR
jgi:hypothetical protein